MASTVDFNDDYGAQLREELSRINLLRIRGDLSSAKTLCLATLKKYPASVDAHTMMGDLHAEQADLGPAAEWYSLALDLDPNAPGVQLKLNRIRAAQDISKQASAHQAMIDSGRKISPWLVAAVASLAIAICTIAYMVGGQKSVATAPGGNTQGQNFKSESISAPRDFDGATTGMVSQTPVNAAPPVGNSASSFDRPAEFGAAEAGKNEPAGSSLSVAQDETLLTAIKERTKFAKNIISILDDPRNHSMVVTYKVAPDEHGRYTGAVVALTALEYHGKAALVTLRGVRNGILTYMGDVSREKVLLAQAEKGSLKDAVDHSWIDDVLENEYFRSQEVTGVPVK
jgi:hypothetical protein